MIRSGLLNGLSSILNNRYNNKRFLDDKLADYSGGGLGEMPTKKGAFGAPFPDKLFLLSAGYQCYLQLEFVTENCILQGPAIHYFMGCPVNF